MTFETEIEDENEVSQKIEVTCSITKLLLVSGTGYGVEDLEATTQCGDSIDLTEAQLIDVADQALKICFEQKVDPQRSMYSCVVGRRK